MTRWSRDEGGQALILIAAALGGLLLGIGLALDTGQLFVARRAAQTAADAGAWAGAAILYAGGSVRTGADRRGDGRHAQRLHRRGYVTCDDGVATGDRDVRG